ncbi:MAG: response regulator [Deltaproteobacteria bacterium]|nr:response regulator [Deltaproteobacteria bacterium]
MKNNLVIINLISNSEMAEQLEFHLGNTGFYKFSVHFVENWKQFKQKIDAIKPDLIFVENSILGTDPAAYVQKIRKKTGIKPVVIISDKTDSKRVLELFKADIDDEINLANFNCTTLKKTIINSVSRYKLRKELEKYKNHYFKKEKLGTTKSLAGGVADYFSYIAEQAEEGFDFLTDKITDVKLLEEVEMLRNNNTHLKKMISHLHHFSGRGPKQYKNIPILPILESTCEILKKTIPDNITLKKNFEANNPLFKGSEKLVSQVLFRLVNNAVEAMTKGGIVEIEFKTILSDSAYLLENPELQYGKYALIEVKDQGEGIDWELREQIFKPFFTTRSTANNVGLGLSLVRQNIHALHGTIEYIPQSNGSIFRILIPITRITAEMEALHEDKGVDKLKKEKAILIVDDEKLILKITERILTQMGYRVFTAKNGQDAIETFNQHRQQIGGIILDLNMPVLDGRECIRRLKTRHGLNVPVLISSGDGTAVDIDDLKAYGVVGMISKPYGVKNLVSRVNALFEIG